MFTMKAAAWLPKNSAHRNHVYQELIYFCEELQAQEISKELEPAPTCSLLRSLTIASSSKTGRAAVWIMCRAATSEGATRIWPLILHALNYNSPVLGRSSRLMLRFLLTPEFCLPDVKLFGWPGLCVSLLRCVNSFLKRSMADCFYPHQKDPASCVLTTSSDTGLLARQSSIDRSVTKSELETKKLPHKFLLSSQLTEAHAMQQAHARAMQEQYSKMKQRAQLNMYHSTDAIGRM
jgi:hypothetical protein